MALGAVLVSGCTSARNPHDFASYPVSKAHFRHDAEIGHGRIGTNEWTLMAKVSGDGDLCMGVKWAPQRRSQEMGCGFGIHDPDAIGEGQSPVDLSTSPDDRVTLLYAPAPARATVALITPVRHDHDAQACVPSATNTRQVRITDRLPDWYHGPRGGWLATPIPSALARHSCDIAIAFLDANGNTVPPPYNF